MKKNLVPLILIIGLLAVQTASAGWVQSNGPSGNITVFVVSGNNIFAENDYDSAFHSNDNSINWTKIGDNKGTFLTLIGDTIFEGSGLSIFKTSNNGTTWTSAASDLPWPNGSGGFGSPSVEFFSVSGSRYFAEVFLYQGLGAGQTGIFVSNNKGKNWVEADSGRLLTEWENYVSLLDSNLFVFNAMGIFLSTNNGINWKEADSGLPGGALSMTKLGT